MGNAAPCTGPWPPRDGTCCSGPVDAWRAQAPTQLSRRSASLTVHRLTAQGTPGALHDPDGRALRRLGLTARDTAQYLVRPDGHIGYRAGGTDLTGLASYLARWLPEADR